jgi:sugar transferase (PEP-CTERM system associated)
MTVLGLHVPRVSAIVFASEGLFFLSYFYLILNGVFNDHFTDDYSLGIHVIFMSVFLLTSLYALGTYRYDGRRLSLRTLERFLFAAVLSAFAAKMVMVVLTAPHLQQQLSLLELGIVMGSGAAIAAGVRGAGQQLVFLLQSLKPRVLILGNGPRAVAVAEVIAERRPVKLVGRLALGDGATVRPVVGGPPHGDLSTLVREEHVDEIIVALDDRRGLLPVDALLQCRMAGVRVTDAAAFLERETGRVDIDVLRPSCLIFSPGFQKSRLREAGKRTVDILLSALGLALALPLLLPIMAAIRFDSPGPIFYTQTRIGMGGRHFTIFKFRSMCSDAERGQAQWASQNDPRITRVGRVLRRTRLDEVPQLFNVLRGDMSLVGPRPERPEFVTELADQLPYYTERHLARPGLTGWAQINYKYGSTVDDAKSKLLYDLYYVKNQGALLDILIILQTLRIIVSGEGAH